jgi:phosphohistidine swiveling domain-containing protein
MVLGVLDATLLIPEGAQVAVDGVAGVVRWMR